MSQLHKTQINQVDYYLILDIFTNTIYEKFRTKTAANNFINNHPLKEDLKLTINPKYVLIK